MLYLDAQGDKGRGALRFLGRSLTQLWLRMDKESISIPAVEHHTETGDLHTKGQKR